MTINDLPVLYKQEKGTEAPQTLHNLPEVQVYIDWLEENLALMTNCVDELTVAMKKVTELMNRTNPLIG